jgi:hypothetical protein
MGPTEAADKHMQPAFCQGKQILAAAAARRFRHCDDRHLISDFPAVL